MQEQDISYAPIESLEFFEEEKELIDIAVTGDHTFFVSADRENWVLTHNSEFPDIDTDVADRDLLIGLLKERFGDTNVVPVSNYNTFQLKSLIKDVSRFFGLDFQEVNSILTPLDREVRSKVLKQGDDKNLFELKLEDALEHSPRFKQFSEEHPEVFDSISILLHENKALGKHAGGVIVEDDLPNKMPLILSRGEPQTPWVEGMHLKTLNEFGHIKCDLLGLETLRIIQRCIELIMQRHEGNARPTFQDVKGWYDKKLHPDVLDMGDQHVYEHVYQEARWAGIFQFTAKGAQHFCKRAKPKSIIEIAAITSIYRPGPLVAGVDKGFVAAKEAPDDVVYEHPLIKEVLGETFGYLVFQEQMLRLGNIVGKMPLAKCDRLRKVITKRSMSGKAKAQTESEELGEEFIAGALENGFTEEQAERLWDNMSAFKGYAFNLSHALSYAIDSYQCAWLLTYYEPEWLCAYMETQAGHPDKRAKAISELRSFGYEIVKVDINHATDQWTILPGKRFMPSFLTVKGMGKAAVEEIERNRPYASVYDLLWDEQGTWRHSKFNKRAMEALIKVGGFASMDIVGPGRTFFGNLRQMHACIIEDQQKLKNKRKGRDELQERLKATVGMEEWPKGKLIEMSKELVGSADLDLIISSQLRGRLDDMGIASIDDFEEKGVYWFIVDDVMPKMTKTKKTYLLLTVMGPSGRSSKCYAWGWNPQKHDMVEKNVAYLAEMEQSDFGFATSIWKLKPMHERKGHADVGTGEHTSPEDV